MAYPEITETSGEVEYTVGNPDLPEMDDDGEGIEQTKKIDLDVIARHVQAKFASWRDARTQLEKKWLAYYRQWRCIQDSQDQTRNSERSKLKMPKTKEAVTNYTTSMLQILFAADPYFDLHQNQPEDKRPGYLRQYIRWLHARENWRNKVKLHLTEQAIYGTGFLRQRAIVETKERVVTRTQPRIAFDALSNRTVQIGEEQVQERLETDYTRPTSEPISIFNLYVNPTATNVQNAEGVIIRSMKSPSDLGRMLAEKAIEVLPKKRENSSGPTIEATDTLQRRLSSIGIQTSSETDQVEIFEAMIWIPADVLKEAGLSGDDGEGDEDDDRTPTGKEMHIIVANGTVLNPSTIEPAYGYNERPILQDWFEQVPNEFYGIGIAEISQGPQAALDATVRSRLDNKAIAINQVFAADRRKLTSGQDLSIYPGKIFLTEGPPGDIIQQMPVQDVTQGTYIEAQEYERYIDSAHGIKPVVGGGAGKKGEQTATETQANLGQAMGIVREMASNFEQNIMVKSYCWYARIISMYPNPEELAQIINPVTGAQDVLHIPTGLFASSLPPGSESLMGTDEPEFIPLGLISMQKRDIAGKIMNFLAATANPSDGPLVDRRYLLQEAWAAIGTGLDKDRVIPNPQQAMEQAMLQNLPGVVGAGMGGAPMPGAASQPAPEVPSSQPGEMLPMSAPGGTPRA